MDVPAKLSGLNLIFFPPQRTLELESQLRELTESVRTLLQDHPDLSPRFNLPDDDREEAVEEPVYDEQITFGEDSRPAYEQLDLTNYHDYDRTEEAAGEEVRNDRKQVEEVSDKAVEEVKESHENKRVEYVDAVKQDVPEVADLERERNVHQELALETEGAHQDSDKDRSPVDGRGKDANEELLAKLLEDDNLQELLERRQV